MLGRGPLCFSLTSSRLIASAVTVCQSCSVVLGVGLQPKNFGGHSAIQLSCACEAVTTVRMVTAFLTPQSLCVPL